MLLRVARPTARDQRLVWNHARKQSARASVLYVLAHLSALGGKAIFRQNRAERKVETDRLEFELAADVRQAYDILYFPEFDLPCSCTLACTYGVRSSEGR